MQPQRKVLTAKGEHLEYQWLVTGGQGPVWGRPFTVWGRDEEAAWQSAMRLTSQLRRSLNLSPVEESNA